ncbi:MAG: hypothetical protein L6Q76_29210, partial [Polyangiaceae bacterium]|nr:hypothetical protein [Polyangiaceae bacterium]
LSEQGSRLSEQGSALARRGSRLSEQGSALARRGSRLSKQGSALGWQLRQLWWEARQEPRRRNFQALGPAPELLHPGPPP